MEALPILLTPEQVSVCLQVSRETVYRYIREGRLEAARLGRGYRIPRVSVERLLWQSRARADIPLRLYSEQEVAGFLRDDALTDEDRTIVATLIRTDRLEACETNRPSPARQPGRDGGWAFA